MDGVLIAGIEILCRAYFYRSVDRWVDIKGIFFFAGIKAIPLVHQLVDFGSCTQIDFAPTPSVASFRIQVAQSKMGVGLKIVWTE